jgi:hypothetical protein
MIRYILFLALSAANFSQNYKEVKIQINSHSEFTTAIELGLDLEHSKRNEDGSISVFVNEDEFNSLVQSGLGYEILVDDWKKYYNSLPVPSEFEKELIKVESENLFGVSGFDFGSMGGYYTLTEIEADLDEMVQDYPNLVTQKFSIGTSLEGRTIWAVRISDNPNVNENEPTVGFDALVHAREPQSMATLMYFMWYLLENYGTNPEVTYLVNNREIYCVPCFNPDGYEYNRQTDPNGGGLWRKNRRNNGTCYGIDLNRNFGYMWGYDNVGSSSNPCSETFRGASAFSEPESQAVRDLAILESYGTHFNMHSHGDYFLYPFGYIDQETPDSLTYREFAGDMGDLNSYEYGTGPQLLGYPSNGSIRDWMYAEQTLKSKTFGYTIEIGPAFWPTQNQIFPIAQQNVKSNMYQAFVAGEYVQLYDPNYQQEYFLPADAVEMLPKFRNIGLASAYNLTFELSSSSQFITINNGSASIDSIQARSISDIATPFSFVISVHATVEEEIPLIITTRVNGDIASVDTSKIIIGYPSFIFQDDSNDPNTFWTITATPVNSPKWEASTSVFFSPPNSYTDSRLSNYLNNAVVTMTQTNAIDLSTYTNPRFTFRTKFDIQNNSDFGQLRISTNNGSTWTPLTGKYTEPGRSPQPTGQPVYDGIISDWVKEEINLSSYNSAQVKLRFVLDSDVEFTRDGWYVDDIGIFIYTIPTEIQGDTKSIFEYSLEQNFPNPFNPVTSIDYAVKSTEYVSLKVYDILGNEVAILVNEEKPAGKYKVEFDASKLSSGISVRGGYASGVYFYKLQAGNFIEVKKMILMK